jgi:hypothetical protein
MSEAASSTHTRPIFIAGCGRSGTSLLRTLLAAHPAVYIPSESLFIPDYLRDGDRLPKPLLKTLLFNEPQLRCWYTGPSEIVGNSAGTIAAVHERMARLEGASIWGQKTPRFVRHRNLIDQGLGPCSWLLIFRDPRAVCASMRQSGQHTHSVRNACARWKRDNRDIVRFINQPDARPDNVHLVRYETLVQEPESTLSRIFEFLQLPWVPFEDLVRDSRPVFFPGSRFENNTIRGGVLPDPARISDWHSVLSSPEVSYIEHACSGEMASLGYPAAQTPVSSSIAITDSFEKLRDLRIVFRYLLYWPVYPVYTAMRKLVLLSFRWRTSP